MDQQDVILNATEQLCLRVRVILIKIKQNICLALRKSKETQGTCQKKFRELDMSRLHGVPYKRNCVLFQL